MWGAAAGAATEEVFGGHELPLPKKKTKMRTKNRGAATEEVFGDHERSVPKKNGGGGKEQ